MYNADLEEIIILGLLWMELKRAVKADVLYGIIQQI